MKIMIMTDIEGVAGVLNFEDWTAPGGYCYGKAVRLLTGEANAAVDGFFSGGAREVVLVDGHGLGGLDPELLDERARLARGRCDPIWPWDLDKTFAALAFIGQHAKAGTHYSHLTHTQGFAFIDLAVNGLSIGEYGQLALCAMELGVPTILACGEQAFAEEAAALTPGVVTVAGKQGVLRDGLDNLDSTAYAKAKLTAIHASPGRVRAMIRDGALKAITKLKQDPRAFHYPKLSPPYVRTARFRAHADTPAHSTRDEHPDSIIALMNMPYTRQASG